MSSLTQAAGAMPAFAAPLRRAFHALRAAWRRGARAIARRRRLAIARAEFAMLDDAALRDLGLRRAEFASYWAESEGLVEATRHRVLRQVDRSLGW